MSSSQVINGWLNRTYKIIAILLVIFAVLISALRIFLPYAHYYKQDVQDFINRTNNSNIIIGELSMGWGTLGPSLVVKRISLLQTQSADAYIEQIDIHLNFWQSLLKARVITEDVTLEGVKVSLQTTELSAKENEQTLIERITEIFLDSISQFTLLNSQIIVQTDHIEKTLLISQLNWLNSGDRHRAKGYVVVDGLTSNNIKVLLDVNGETPSSFDGQLYFQANQLNITPWLDTVFAIDNDDTHSSINFDGWVTIKEDLPLQLQVVLNKNEVSWKHNNEEQSFSVNEGQIIAQSSRDFNQVSVFSSPLMFVTNNHKWKPTEFQFTKNADTVNAFTHYLDVKGVCGVIPLFSSKMKALEAIESLSPKGILSNVHFKSTNGMPVLYAQANKIKTKEYRGIPGVQNMNTDISFQNNTLNFKLQASDGELDFGKHLLNPIPYNDIKADVDFTSIDNNWDLTFNSIEMNSNELSLSSELSVTKSVGHSTEMALLTRVTHLDAEFANHYYPHLLMGENLVNYLNSAIVDGSINQTQILFNGPLNKFPFNNNEGIFSVNAELTDSTFTFDSAWPAIQDFNANLNFTNGGMLITGRSGTLEGLNVKGVTVGINDLLHERILKVDAEFINADPMYVTNLMNSSPLSKSVGSALKSIKITNPISGGFSLALPFKNIKNTIAKGTIDFNNNNIELKAPSMLFKNVYGQLAYNNDKITTNNIKLNWRDMPLILSVNANNEDELYNTDININAQWDNIDWSKQLPENLRSYISGDLWWEGLLSLDMYRNGDFSYNFDIKSNLEKAMIDLPAPYKKLENIPEQLTFNVSGVKGNSIINAALGDELSFYGELHHKRAVFDKAHLMLGKKDMLLPENGFHITTNLEQANIKEWHPFISDILNSTKDENVKKEGENSSPSLLGKPKVVGDIKLLTFDEYALSDVQYSLTGEQLGTLLDINAKEISAKVMLNDNLLEQGIDIKADFLNIAKKEKVELVPINTESIPVIIDNNTSVISDDLLKVKRLKNENSNKDIYANLPPIKAICTHCIIDNVDLGEVEFDISRNEHNHIELTRFVASRDKSVVSFQGLWKQTETENTTRIFGKLNIDNLEQEVEQLGYEPTIKDSGLYSEFALNWQSAPYEFSLASLNGEFNAQLDDGYLAEVPDQARVFSVLSLQSLVRKLSFDFRDIFSDGMFYSKITGDYQLNNGVLYTDNMFMKGAAGDLEVKGNSDLGKQLLDIRMSYKPNVTSSLPALAWIATLNPVTFLAGIALEEAITSKVYYELNFELTGTMSEPIFKDVNRKTRNISVGRTVPSKIVDDLIKPDNIKQPLNDLGAPITPILNSDEQRIQKMRIDG